MSANSRSPFVGVSYGIFLLATTISLSAIQARGATTAYVPTRDGMWALDTTSNTAVSSIALPQRSAEMVLTPDGKFAYVSMPNGPSGSEGNNVAVVSMATNAVVANVTVGSTPAGLAITPNGKFVYVANSGWSSVWVIATDTNTVAATVTTGTGPDEIAITPDGAFAYVTNILSNSVAVIDTAANTVVKTIGVGANAHSIAISADGKRAYVSAGKSIAVIDTATKALVNTIAMTSEAGGLAITPDGRFLYASSGTFYVGYSISVIDTTTNAMVANIPETQAGNPAPLAMSPDGTCVYVSDANGVASASSVTVISTATNTVIATIPTGIATGAVVFAPDMNQNSAVSSISFTPSNVSGGASSTGTIILTAAAPLGGALVSLVSNDPSVTVPASVVVAGGSKTAQFSIATSPVTETTSATVSATYKNVSKTAQLTISPVGQVSISSVSVNPVSVSGGVTATGTVTLSAPAPAGGVVVDLWTNGSPAFVPVSISIPAGATNGSFPVTTNYVTSATQGVITAFYNGLSRTANITVTPPTTLLSVSVPAQTIGAGFTATGTVTLSAPAPEGGTVVYLWTNGSPAFVPTSVTVSPGALAATFPVTTIYVSSPTQGTITAFYNGTAKTATITVTP